MHIFYKNVRALYINARICCICDFFGKLLVNSLHITGCFGIQMLSPGKINFTGGNFSCAELEALSISTATRGAAARCSARWTAGSGRAGRMRPASIPTPTRRSCTAG